MLKTLILTNEYPPKIYGGAGVHVDYLARELAHLCKVDVRCFGPQLAESSNLSVHGVELPPDSYAAPKNLHSVFGAVERCLRFNTRGVDADVVHVHTWYAHWGGILAKLNYGIPLVLTVHSLEPLRPWKREQLGNGYDFTLWVEKTAIEMADAVVAVSRETREDILRLFDIPPEKVHIIPNGVDPTEYAPVSRPEILQKYRIETSRPYVLFVGRITRQKGIIHLVNAISYMDPSTQVVLLAGAPDTPEIAREMKLAVDQAGPNVIWIEEMLDTEAKIALYSHAAIFCCPSIYEPFGIINLEAMACETPVVASRVGGMKEIIIDGETGVLVPLEQHQQSPFEPLDPDAFSRDLARAIDTLMGQPELRRNMGLAGRRRVEQHYGWRAVAERTHELYASLL